MLSVCFFLFGRIIFLDYIIYYYYYIYFASFVVFCFVSCLHLVCRVVAAPRDRLVGVRDAAPAGSPGSPRCPCMDPQLNALQEATLGHSTDCLFASESTTSPVQHPKLLGGQGGLFPPLESPVRSVWESRNPMGGGWTGRRPPTPILAWWGPTTHQAFPCSLTPHPRITFDVSGKSFKSQHF